MNMIPRVLPIFVLMSFLTGCHEPYRLTVANGTSQTLSTRINYFDPSLPTGHGDLGPGVRLDLTEKSSGIRSIEYEIDGRSCRIEGLQIENLAQTGSGSRPVITLVPCSEDDR